MTLTATATVPFDWKWSKNRLWVHARDGSVKLATHARSRRDELAQVLLLNIRGKIAHNKLSFGYHVYAPDHHGDAINALDLVADAIEIATGLDDRWFECSGIRWDIRKDSPILTVFIEQPDLPDVQACGTCGKILNYGAFNKGSNKRGLAGTCRLCMKTKRAKAKEPRVSPEPFSAGGAAPW